MKALILAAGYGTRMQSLIGDRPKALVDIQGQTILDRLVTDLESLGVEAILVTNARYYKQFLQWQKNQAQDVLVLNDGSTDPETRLGAIGDMAFAIESAGVEDDLLILAADNLLTFSLAGMLSAFRQHHEIHLAVWTNPDMADQRRRGVVTVGEDQRVLSFEEKPTQPGSALVGAPIYLFPRHLLGEPQRYLDSGGNPDAPGHLMAHLVKRVPMWAWPVPGEILDVGNPESYHKALSARL